MKDEFDRDLSYCVFCKSTTPHIKGDCIPCTKEEETKVKYSQVWSCIRCKETGAIQYTEDESQERIVNKIIEDHSRRTVLCDGGAHTINIHPPIDEVN